MIDAYPSADFVAAVSLFSDQSTGIGFELVGKILALSF
jgi:hypothetical protein